MPEPTLTKETRREKGVLCFQEFEIANARTKRVIKKEYRVSFEVKDEVLVHGFEISKPELDNSHFFSEIFSDDLKRSVYSVIEAAIQKKLLSLSNEE